MRGTDLQPMLLGLGGGALGDPVPDLPQCIAVVLPRPKANQCIKCHKNQGDASSKF